MYSMWNNSFDEVREYLLYSNHYNTALRCIPFSFQIPERGLVSNFRIEELDLLTSSCPTKDHFIEKLLQYSDTYIKNPDVTNIIITHTRKGKVYEDEVIYDNQFIYSCALEKSRIRKKSGNQKNKVMLKNSQPLLDFIEYIKSLALNPETRDYLLYPTKLGDDVSMEDKLLLKSFVKEDFQNENGTIMHRELKSLLEEYINVYTSYEDCSRSGLPALEHSYDLDSINNRINQFFRSSYRHIRNSVVWENNYYRILKSQINSTTDRNRKCRLQILMDEVIAQRNYRNGVLSKEGLIAFYEERENTLLFIEEESITGDIENDFIRQLYAEGGIDLVMRNLDSDEIYGPRYHDDMVRLGVIKEKTNNHKNS